MAKYFLIFICIVSLSCNRESSSKSKQDSSSKKIEEMMDTLSKLKHTHEGHFKEVHAKQDSIKHLILKQHANGINAYTFSLEGVFSAEGNEGKASYKNNKIDRIEITFYGESGKNVYIYQFKNNRIEVTQQRYDYKTNFMEVKSKDDIIKGEKIEYTLDTNGKIIDGDKTEMESDVFLDLQKAIPFDLN